MIFKRTDQGTFGVLVMTNVNSTFNREGHKREWSRSYYSGFEQLRSQAVEEMLVQ